MGFIIGILTFVMVLDCIALIFLVLIQLPKKEAGAGLAFGGAATDALFGAGSGTVLTKVTRYAATIFFVLAFIVAIMQKNYHRGSDNKFKNLVTKGGTASPGMTPATPPNPPTTATPVATNLPAIPLAESTNAPAAPTTPAPATNAPAPK
jgi:preprotein translocase subunit SecG